MLFLGALILSVFVEALLYRGVFWRAKIPLVIFLTAIISVSSVSLLLHQPSVASGILLLLGLLRIGNYLRIAKGRMHDSYLLRATRRTSFWLLLISMLPLAAVWLDVSFVPQLSSLYGIAALQVIAALTMISLLLFNIRKTSYRQGTTFFADKELPSLSVLIPARNETDDLELCLRSCLASDYPKLEIVVLDDCSHHETSEIIKKFAQDGVRFIKGSEPDQKWLAKNAAYERLSAEASGEILLFAGVDVRFGSHTFRALVTEMLARDKQMISVLPRRFSSNLSHAFVQPLRYWWELVLPRTLLNRPAVLSTCWLIRKKKLKKLGGFAAISRSIIPERFFARELIKTNDYSFIRASDIMDVQTAKSFADQRSTAIRVKYPQLSKRPELVLAITLAQFILLIGPFIGVVVSLLMGNTIILALSGVSCTVLVLVHIMIIHLTNPVNILAAVWNLPYAVAVDILLSLYSMYKYEFGEVIWKERNVCIPVMHVAPHLPKID